MAYPRASEAITQGVRIRASAFYLPDESNSELGKYVFGYRINIANEGAAPVQLVSRHWLIIDGEGEREEVRGAGVVGQTPTIQPGESFEYDSCCPLHTPWGTMEGEYMMRHDSGEGFEARIPRFFLTTLALEPVAQV